jgi:hypothetical protein
MTKRFTRDLQSLLQYIYIYNYLIINILYIYYIVFVNCKSCKRKKLIKSFFTKTDSKGFKTAFTIYNLQNLTSSFYKFGVL